MKTRIQTSARTLEYLVGILATALIAVGLLLYALDEPQRIVQAQQAQLALDLDEAMTLYAENCAVCHGMAGEGIGATPGLDNPGLAAMSADELFKIIARGRFNTAMSAWSLEDGGPLGDYQIGELVALIQFADWPATQERVVNLGLAPKIPFAAQPDAAILEQMRSLPQGETLAQGVTLYAKYCVACHGADGLGTALAPALNDPLVGQKTADELERIIRNGVPATLMAGWSGVLTADQIAALTQLIQRWGEIPDGALPAPDQPAPVTAESLALGAQLYSQACARCHGPDGQGTPRAPALNVLGFLQDINDSAMQQIITLGVPATAMPAWGDRMTEVEIQAIVGFIRAWEPTAPQVAQPLRGPWWRMSGSAPVLPSGGVNPNAAASKVQGVQGKLSRDTQHADTVSGQPPDNRAIALIATLIGVAAAFLLIGVRGLRRAAVTGA
ncbi:MAG: c-type cytochrome [Anaerolineales bacterium]|nr:c-type cytochrome [Anaerolineales bacterium]